MFSIGFEVDVGSSEGDIAEAKCQQCFAVTGNLTEFKAGIRIRQVAIGCDS